MSTDHQETTFVDHLEELRGNLIRIIFAVIIMSVLAFIFKRYIFDYVIFAPKEPYFFTNAFMCALSDAWGIELLCINENPLQIINIKLAGQFRAHLWVSFVAGFILSFPYILFEIWRFVKPALYKKEKSALHGFVFFTSILFMTGVLFGYYIIVPLTVNFLGSYEVSSLVSNQISMSSFISTITMIALSTGLVFELPILIYFLSKMGVVTPQTLRKYRKHTIVACFVLSAIITPPDVFSQVLIFFPLYLLYEASIYISSRVVKKAEAVD